MNMGITARISAEPGVPLMPSGSACLFAQSLSGKESDKNMCVVNRRGQHTMASWGLQTHFRGTAWSGGRESAL